ncbi:MAG TPA: amidohydrolase family protein, partial [Syntrophomonadaceae bacterium]|nr:amidohydrolase family protein [Syntrophomonadaceae bacterium]
DMVYKNPWGLKAALGENPKRVYQMQKKAPQTRMANASILRQSFYTASQLIDSTDLKAQERYQYEPLFRVLKKEMPLLLHVHRADDILTALRIQDEYHFDLIIQHGTEALLVADELVKRQVPVFLGPLFSNRAKVEMKELAFENAARLAQRGVKFCFISDHPVIPIEQLRVCAALAVREGLDEETALAALTSIPASLLKLDDELGSIQVGKRADLLILNAHPFDFCSRVEKVFVDGVLWGGMHE